MVRTACAAAFIASLCGLLIACGKPTGMGGSGTTSTTGSNAITNDGLPITTRGIIQRSEVTSYQYGAYTLLDESGRTLYALTTRCITSG